MSTNYTPRPGIPTEEEAPDHKWVWVWNGSYGYMWTLQRAEDLRCRLEYHLAMDENGGNPPPPKAGQYWLPKDALPIPKEDNQ